MRDTPTPFRESLRATLTRTVGIAVAVGAVLAWRSGTLRSWPLSSLLVLWFSLGGHWVELWFLNWLRPRLGEARVAHIAARLVIWFVGGAALGAGVAMTMRLARWPQAVRQPAWWLAGFAFIAVELCAHAALSLRRRPNFYSGER